MWIYLRIKDKRACANILQSPHCTRKRRWMVSSRPHRPFDRPSNAWVLYLYAGSNSAAPLGTFERRFFVPCPASVEVQPPARSAEARGRRLRALHQSTAGDMSRLVASCGRRTHPGGRDWYERRGATANSRAELRGRIPE